MSEEGGSVTLVFYKIDSASVWHEPALNLLAAACQLSPFTHVELAIGDNAGAGGQMTNVCRIFNDAVGVELASRTGRNPRYSYLQLGCSKRSEEAMLRYAHSLVGRPFSNTAMARSIIFPRQTDGTSFFCAGASREPPPSTRPSTSRFPLHRARRLRPEAGWFDVQRLESGQCNTRDSSPRLQAGGGRHGQPFSAQKHAAAGDRGARWSLLAVVTDRLRLRHGAGAARVSPAASRAQAGRITAPRFLPARRGLWRRSFEVASLTPSAGAAQRLKRTSWHQELDTIFKLHVSAAYAARASLNRPHRLLRHLP